MSLPRFPDVPDGFTFDKSIYQILTSIAMEEIGLSHVINAEGEKLQYVLGTLDGSEPPELPTIDQVLEVNESVQETLKQVAFNQMFLSSKMSEALKAYWQSKNGTGGSGGNGNGGNGGNGGDKEPPPPVDNPPEVIDGGILTPEQTGDSENWIKIAKYGKYILIVRSKFINYYPNGHPGETNWQYTDYGPTNAYKTSLVRKYINAWFNGPVTGTTEKLPDNARLRNFTMQNDAVNVLGTGYSEAGGLANGFSKPTNIQIPSGSDDVAFALSFTEVANFISKSYTIKSSGGIADSNPTAIANYGKLEALPSGRFGMWLRSPGASPDTAGELSCVDGRAFQFHINASTFGESGFIYPALWIDSEMFETAKQTVKQ